MLHRRSVDSCLVTIACGEWYQWRYNGRDSSDAVRVASLGSCSTHGKTCVQMDDWQRQSSADLVTRQTGVHTRFDPSPYSTGSTPG